MSKQSDSFFTLYIKEVLGDFMYLRDRKRQCFVAKCTPKHFLIVSLALVFDSSALTAQPVTIQIVKSYCYCCFQGRSNKWVA